MTDFDIHAFVRPTIAKLVPYSSARDEYTAINKDVIFLDANENPFETNVNRYPDPQQRSLKAILASQKGVAVDTILLGNGSDEVLDLVFRAFCEPNKDNVITLPPTYGMYGVLANINAIENREVILTVDFEPNFSEILKRQDNFSKILFICSPNNPTGNIFKRATIEALLTSFKGLVVIDEAYIDFSEAESWVHSIDKYPNLIVTQTLSKAYGMAGIRLGICIASKEIIKILNTIKPPYNVNQLTQRAALKRITDTDILKNEIGLITSEKERLLEALVYVKFVQKIYPSNSNFVLIKVDNATQRYNELCAVGIVVRNRTNQPLCKNTLRITIGTKEENNRLITELKRMQ